MATARTHQGCLVKRRYHNTKTGDVVEEIELSCEMELALEPRSVERVWYSNPRTEGDPCRNASSLSSLPRQTSRRGEE